MTTQAPIAIESSASHQNLTKSHLVADRIVLVVGLIVLAVMIFASGMFFQAQFLGQIAGEKVTQIQDPLAKLECTGGEGSRFSGRQQSQPSLAAFLATVGLLSNEERIKAGKTALTRSVLLDTAAQAKLDHMLEHHYWTHIAPDGNDPWFIFRKVGYDFQLAGENLARDYGTPSGVVDGGMSSQTHRDNLLMVEYTQLGLAAKCLPGEGWMVVAHYGVPR